MVVQEGIALSFINAAVQKTRYYCRQCAFQQVANAVHGELGVGMAVGVWVMVSSHLTNRCRFCH